MWTTMPTRCIWYGHIDGNTIKIHNCLPMHCPNCAIDVFHSKYQSLANSFKNDLNVLMPSAKHLARDSLILVTWSANNILNVCLAVTSLCRRPIMSFTESQCNFFSIKSYGSWIGCQISFGLYSRLEAVHCGCMPVAPNRLVYPEIYPKENLYNTLAQLVKMLANWCGKPRLFRKRRDKFFECFNFQPYSIQSLLPFYLSQLSIDSSVALSPLSSCSMSHTEQK